LSFGLNIALSATTSDAKKEAYKRMSNSNRVLHDTCMNIAENFRYDHQFAGYMKSKCLFFESDRQRLVSSIFTLSTTNNSSYKENYPILMSNFVVKINDNEIQEYRTIVQEYCKYNAWKFSKKNPNACRRIDSLF
jgi:hypothetical protein